MTAAPESLGRATRRSSARLAKLRRAAFRKARRHTWTVRALRLLMPLSVLGLIGTYGTLLYAKLGIRLGSGQVKVQAIEITTEDLKMKGVTYDGVTKDGGRYDVRAAEAQVDITQKGPVRLALIDGDLRQANGVKTNLKSKRGILDNDKGEMDLFDGVTIDASNGLKARMKSAKVFNKENRVVAKEGVEAETQTGRITSRTMELHTKERKGVFTGDVAVRVTPDAAASKSALGGTSGKDAREPIDVRSAKLEFDDLARVAHFTGGVTAVQGGSQLAATALRLTYEGRASVPGLPEAGRTAPSRPGAAAAASVQSGTAGGGTMDPAAAATRLQKLSATGQIVITQGDDRKITAETMDLDVPADTALFTGPAVEIIQGKNRLLGQRLEVDRKSGKSRLSSPAEGKAPPGRIKTTFVQEQKPGAAVKAATPAAPAAGAAGGLLTLKADPNAPIDIDAETLDVNDQAKQAVFRKAVRAQQGDFTIQSAELIATYSGDTGLMSTGDADAKKTQAAQIQRIEARENVVITGRDGQQATGQRAVFEQKSNTVLLTGNVNLKQGRTIIDCTRVQIVMTTGVFECENDGSQPSIGTAAAPATAPKSASGPGGLPQVGGIQMPTAPAPPRAGRQSLTVFPEDWKKKSDEKNAAKAVPKAPKAETDGWKPTTSPSPVYRSQ